MQVSEKSIRAVELLDQKLAKFHPINIPPEQAKIPAKNIKRKLSYGCDRYLNPTAWSVPTHVLKKEGKFKVGDREVGVMFFTPDGVKGYEALHWIAKEYVRIHVNRLRQLNQAVGN